MSYVTDIVCCRATYQDEPLYRSGIPVDHGVVTNPRSIGILGTYFFDMRKYRLTSSCGYI